MHLYFVQHTEINLLELANTCKYLRVLNRFLLYLIEEGANSGNIILLESRVVCILYSLYIGSLSMPQFVCPSGA